ncbi:hypothetical protein [Micrococcoides hystricis]|uniref:Uncharacterized protein n=1 Tax=Micrococcoides hystricis TaxID=1572761 RepID=A0ABV6PAW1_9MICC
MGEYLVPLAIVVGIVVLTLGAYRLFKSRPTSSSGSSSEPGFFAGLKALSKPVTEQDAQEAAAKLNPEQHKRIYGLIARGQHQLAAQAFQQLTGASVLDSLLAVNALATYPTQARQAQAEQADPFADDLAAHDAVDFEELDSGELDHDGLDVVPENQLELPGLSEELSRQFDDFTVPESWGEEPTLRNQAFELQVTRDEETIRISSDDLGPWVHDQLAAMVRDGDLESGAALLAANTELSEPEARQFLEIMAERDQQLGSD